MGFKLSLIGLDRTGVELFAQLSALYSLTSPSSTLITFSFIRACLVPKDHRYRSRVGLNNDPYGSLIAASSASASSSSSHLLLLFLFCFAFCLFACPKVYSAINHQSASIV